MLVPISLVGPAQIYTIPYLAGAFLWDREESWPKAVGDLGQSLGGQEVSVHRHAELAVRVTTHATRSKVTDLAPYCQIDAKIATQQYFIELNWDKTRPKDFARASSRRVELSKSVRNRFFTCQLWDSDVPCLPIDYRLTTLMRYSASRKRRTRQ